MAEKRFEFQKIRDFGENISDTFLFIRQESRPLLRSFFAICAVFILLNAVVAGLFQYNFLKTMAFDPYSGSIDYGARLRGVFSPLYFMTILTSVMALTSMEVALFGYIKLYTEKGNESPEIDEVWSLFKKYFLKVFFYHLPILFIIIIGTVCCLIPGVYFFTVFAPFATILVIEELSFSEAFSRCFYLIREEFWLSFGIYVIAYILYYIASMLFGGIFSGAGYLLKFLTSGSFFETQQVIQSFVNFFGLIFYIIPLTSITLHFFTLREKKDGTGIMNRIDSIGERNRNLDDSDEEY